MSSIEIYTTGYCGFCVRAKRLLEERGLEYTEIRVDSEPARRAEMMERSGRRTVPQVFIGGKSIGGCDELYHLDHTGALQEMLQAPESSY